MLSNTNKNNSIQFNEDERKHLSFIESIISRMNTNSFQIKTFTITIFSALIALYINDSKSNKSLVFVALIPTIIFWLLDAFYLQTERKYRKLYTDVVNKKVSIYSLDISEYNNCETCYVRVLFSKTIFLIYASLLLIIATIYIRL